MVSATLPLASFLQTSLIKCIFSPISAPSSLAYASSSHFCIYFTPIFSDNLIFLTLLWICLSLLLFESSATISVESVMYSIKSKNSCENSSLLVPCVLIKTLIAPSPNLSSGHSRQVPSKV